MVNFDRPMSVISTQFKTITEAATTRLKTVSPKIEALTAAAGPRLKTVSPKALTTASPKVKAIAAGGALAFVAGITAPVLTASHSDSTPAIETVAVVADDSSPHNAPAKGAKAPSTAQLHPVGIQGSQSDFTPTADQMRNAKKIIQTGQAMGLPPRAWVIAVATSMQETHLHNYGDLGDSNDHDSLGLFQQRPSSGWGSPDQLKDPTYAAKAFYKGLTQVPGWDKMPLTDAAQTVQVSAYGDRYAQWEAHAGDVVDGFYGQGPLANAAHKAK